MSKKDVEKERSSFPTKVFLVSEKNLIELKSISDIELDEQTGYIVEDNLKEWVDLTPKNLRCKR